MKKIIKKNINIDCDFYRDLYDDLKLLDDKECYFHYLNYGKKEGRVCNKYQLKKIIDKNLKTIESQKYIKFKKKENKINILIRTSYKKDDLEKNIESILSQNYSNYQIIISYDNKEALNYLEQYQNNDKIYIFKVNKNDDYVYFYNLYCNDLISKVTDGWIMFLDDDDMLSHQNVLNIINNYLEKNKILVWKFMRPDKNIYPLDLKNIKLGEIASCNFIFNKNNLNKSKWNGEICGDFKFFKELLKNDINLKLKFINYILTKTIFNDKIGNYGE